jgi:hypothetical protein
LSARAVAESPISASSAAALTTVPATSVRSIDGVGRTGRGLPGRGGGSGRGLAADSGTAFSFGALAGFGTDAFAAAAGLVEAFGAAAGLVEAFGAAAGLDLAGVLGLAGALGLVGGLGLTAATDCEAASASVRAARLVLRRSGREVGSELRTLDGGLSLISSVSPRTCNISNKRQFRAEGWQSCLQLCDDAVVSTDYMQWRFGARYHGHHGLVGGVRS